MSLPAALPVRAVKRYVCGRCESTCDAAQVREVRPSAREQLRGVVPSMPALPSVSLPSRLDPRWLTLPIAAAAVFVALSLANGEPAPAPEPPAASEAVTRDPAPAPAERVAKQGGGGKPAKTAVPADAQLVAESTFSLALPAGWDRVKPAAGATFGAVAPDGTADATLWITNDPKLDFAAFEASSLAQLEALAGSAQVVERSAGPTVESTTVTLAPKKVAEGSPTYEVVLRGSGDNWYYLATTHQAGASSEAIAGVDLIQGSFLPLGGKG